MTGDQWGYLINCCIFMVVGLFLLGLLVVKHYRKKNHDNTTQNSVVSTSTASNKSKWGFIEACMAASVSIFICGLSGIIIQATQEGDTGLAETVSVSARVSGYAILGVTVARSGSRFQNSIIGKAWFRRSYYVASGIIFIFREIIKDLFYARSQDAFQAGPWLDTLQRISFILIVIIQAFPLSFNVMVIRALRQSAMFSSGTDRKEITQRKLRFIRNLKIGFVIVLLFFFSSPAAISLSNMFTRIVNAIAVSAFLLYQVFFLFVTNSFFEDPKRRPSHAKAVQAIPARDPKTSAPPPRQSSPMNRQ